MIKENADILAVPAWTATLQGNRKYAKLEWHSLTKTQSTGYSVIVAVSDHLFNRPKTDVANATVIFDPGNRKKLFPKDDYIARDITVIDLKKTKEARQRWIQKRLAPLAFMQ